MEGGLVGMIDGDFVGTGRMMIEVGLTVGKGDGSIVEVSKKVVDFLVGSRDDLIGG